MDRDSAPRKRGSSERAARGSSGHDSYEGSLDVRVVAGYQRRYREVSQTVWSVPRGSVNTTSCTIQSLEMAIQAMGTTPSGHYGSIRGQKHPRGH